MPNVLPSGTGAASSSDIAVAANARVRIKIYQAAGGEIPSGPELTVQVKTGAIYTPLTTYDGQPGILSNRQTVFFFTAGPAGETLRVDRPDISRFGTGIAVDAD